MGNIPLTFAIGETFIGKTASAVVDVSCFARFAQPHMQAREVRCIRLDASEPCSRSEPGSQYR